MIYLYAIGLWLVVGFFVFRFCEPTTQICYVADIFMTVMLIWGWPIQLLHKLASSSPALGVYYFKFFSAYNSAFLSAIFGMKFNYDFWDKNRQAREQAKHRMKSNRKNRFR